MWADGLENYGMKIKTTLLILISICFIMGTSVCPSAETLPPDAIAYPPLHFSIPLAHRTILQNGIILYIMEDHELPLVSMTAVLHTGSMYDPDSMEGLADITGTVMRTGGTTTMAAGDVDLQLDRRAAILDISMGRDTGTISVSVLAKDFIDTVQLFSDILRNPAFDGEKLELAKSISIETIRRIPDDPQKLAFREFTKLLYGTNPRGRYATPTSVKKITRDDVVAFHRRFFFPANIMIAVSGDVSVDRVLGTFQNYLEAWKAEGFVETLPLRDDRERQSINYLFKDIPQSIIISGWIVPGKLHDDYYAFSVFDFLAGSGGLHSHLTGEIRNNLGLAYSAGSFYAPKTDFGIFAAYAMTASSATAGVYHAMNSILHDMQVTAVNDRELAQARNAMNSSFIFSFSTTHQTVLQQMMVEFEKLPADFLTAYRNGIDRVTSANVRRTAGRFLPDAKNVVLILGNESHFDRPLSNWGAVKKIEIQQ